MAKTGKIRRPGKKTFKIIGEDGQVTIVTRTVVPLGETPSFEKFKIANEILEKAIMLPE
jgi:hypothetical protein